MRSTPFVQTMLTVIILLLAAIALRPLAGPGPAHAQTYAQHLYIEPGTTMLRTPDGSQQVLGKVVIDLGTGKVWGFPTLTDKPYPVDLVHNTPPASHPVYLGRFDFSALTDSGQ